MLKTLWMMLMMWVTTMVTLVLFSQPLYVDSKDDFGMNYSSHLSYGTGLPSDIRVTTRSEC